jgi:hypothetical protein
MIKMPVNHRLSRLSLTSVIIPAHPTEGVNSIRWHQTARRGRCNPAWASLTNPVQLGFISLPWPVFALVVYSRACPCQVSPGHKPEGEHRKYTHHEMDNLRAAVGKIPFLG